MGGGLHHVELWVNDLPTVEAGWRWLLAELGWTEAEPWAHGRTWHHSDGTYLVVEQSPAVTGAHDRMTAGLNHLALNCADRAALDRIRTGALEHGWSEMFADMYPHAGGPDHTALFLENAQGFEIEVVSP
jgi:catechol-2,3-dioxygenase